MSNIVDMWFMILVTFGVCGVGLFIGLSYAYFEENKKLSIFYLLVAIGLSILFVFGIIYLNDIGLINIPAPTNITEANLTT